MKRSLSVTFCLPDDGCNESGSFRVYSARSYVPRPVAVWIDDHRVYRPGPLVAAAARGSDLSCADKAPRGGCERRKVKIRGA